MPLDHAAAVAAVADWHRAAGAPVTDADAGAVATALVDLADALVPLVVDPDGTLTRAQHDDYLLARARDEVTDWLSRAAAGLRAQLHVGPPVLRRDGTPALGVRTATLDELDAVAGLGPARAAAIARLVRLHPQFTDLADLTSIDGIGEAAVAALSRHLYVDSPAVALTSPSLVDFALHPGLVTYLRVLHTSDLELTVADGGTLRRRPPAGGTPTDRLTRLLRLLTQEAALTRSPARGVLASDAAALLARRALLDSYRAATRPVDGQILTDETYLAAATELIGQAVERVLLLVFLGTDNAGDADHPGPAGLVAALEARAAAGVDVRVVLDQDENGQPYRSLFINRPLHRRLSAGPVQVKFDDPSRLLHSKVLVVDRTAVIVGSHNWTQAGLYDTHELSVLLRGEDIADDYAARFQSVWDSAP